MTERAREVVDAWKDRSITLEEMLDEHRWLYDSLVADITDALTAARRQAWEEAAQFVRNLPAKLEADLGRPTPIEVVNATQMVANEFELAAALRARGEDDGSISRA